MPARDSRKTYYENAYYHVYNRGVEKRKIFVDKQDYSVFLSYLKDYLMPKDEKGLLQQLSEPNLSPSEKDKILKMLRLNNFHGEITLLAYCLMPNHFHFFLKQKSAESVDKFMNSLGTRYTMYFNRKYDRVGSLYQGVYKAVSIITEPQFIYLTKYIHKQAVSFNGHPLQGEALRIQKSHPSSFYDYIGEQNTEWVNSNEVLGYFSKTNPSLSYKSFVMQEQDDNEVKNIKDIRIESRFEPPRRRLA